MKNTIKSLLIPATLIVIISCLAVVFNKVHFFDIIKNSICISTFMTVLFNIAYEIMYLGIAIFFHYKSKFGIEKLIYIYMFILLLSQISSLYQSQHVFFIISPFQSVILSVLCNFVEIFFCIKILMIKSFEDNEMKLMKIYVVILFIVYTINAIAISNQVFNNNINSTNALSFLFFVPYAVLLFLFYKINHSKSNVSDLA